MNHRTTWTRTSAVVAASALAVGGFAALGTVLSPAQAATSLNYTCSMPQGTTDVPVELSTTLPSKATAGQSLSGSLTAKVILPDDARTGLLGAGYRQGAGSASASIAFNGAAKSVALSIPSSTIPMETGSFALTATGALPAITAGAAGTTTTVDAQNFNVALNLTPANIFLGGSFNLACTLKPGQNARITSVAVAATNVAPKTKAKVALVTKKNKAKSVVIRATDANRDRLTYKVTKKSPKGKVTMKGAKATFKPKKNWTGNTSFIVTVSDGKGGIARAKVVVKVKR